MSSSTYGSRSKTNIRFLIIGNNCEDVIGSKYKNVKNIDHDDIVSNYLPMIWGARGDDGFLQNPDLKIYDIGDIKKLGDLINKYKKIVDDNTFFNNQKRDEEIIKIEIEMIKDLPFTFHIHDSGMIITPKTLKMGKEISLIYE